MDAGGLLRLVRRATGRSDPPPAPAKTGIRPKATFPPRTSPFAAVAPLNDRTLLLPEAQLGIIWAPKCACTKVVLWYLNRIGLLEAALFYNPWPHHFRMNVLYRSQKYATWMRTSKWKDFTWYQFGRDPVKRVLSAYRHNLGHGYADERIAMALGRPISYRKGYSLNDFLDYLDKQDLTGDADPHVKLQWQRISKFVGVNVINIDERDLVENLSAIERKHGLPLTDFASLSAFQSDDNRKAKFGGPTEFSPDRVLTIKDARGTWPVEASLLDAATTERIKRLYARDMNFITSPADVAPSGYATDIGLYRKARNVE